MDEIEELANSYDSSTVLLLYNRRKIRSERKMVKLGMPEQNFEHSNKKVQALLSATGEPKIVHLIMR